MAVKPRTDDEKLSIAPIKVQLGGKPYDIPVRKILAARAWREEFTPPRHHHRRPTPGRRKFGHQLYFRFCLCLFAVSRETG